jgi:hypothetical protein
VSLAGRRDYDRRMDEFVDFNENSVLALIAVLLLMAIWACVIVAMDHWVWADGADAAPLPARRPGVGTDGRVLSAQPPYP